MVTPRIILALVLCLLSANALHLQAHQSLLHLQTDAEKQAYLDSLLKIEQQLADNVQQLQKSVEANNKKSSEFASYQSIQTQFLEDALQDERNAISGMESGLLLPLKLKTWECKNISQAEADSIQKEIASTQQKVSTLDSKLKSQVDCLRNDQVQTQIEFLNLYLNHLVSELNNKCSNQVSSKIFYIPNPNSKFTYGQGKTQEQYNQEIQNKLAQGYTSIQCPPETPFPNGLECTGCDASAFYNLETNQCLTCPAGYTFEISTHRCHMVPFNSATTSAQNYYGAVPAPVAGSKTCPDDTPFFNGKECMACPYPSYFDFTDFLCKSCPNGQSFDLGSHLCSYPKFNSNSKAASNYCCGDLPFEQGVQSCPDATPFFNGKSCIQCSLPSYFNIQSKACSICSDGQGFSTVSKSCVNNSFLVPFFQSSITSSTQNYLGTPPKIDGHYENIQNCPSDHPFSNGEHCISCSLPSYFNFNSKLCEICPQDYKFDTDIHKCVHKSTEKFNSNMVIIDNFMGKVPSFNSSLSTCPEATPLFDGSQCVQCKLPNYVDFGTQQCQQCPNQQTFDLFSRECLSGSQDHYTDLTAKNIFYNGQWSTIQKRIETQKKANPSMTVCESGRPYYNAAKGECISCPKEYPLFDIKYNRCISCTGESEYSEERRICVLPGSVKATVERMIMNTVQWV